MRFYRIICTMWIPPGHVSRTGPAGAVAGGQLAGFRAILRAAELRTAGPLNRAEPGKLALVRQKFDPAPPFAIVCRSANRYPIAARIETLPLADLPAFLEDPFP